VGSVATGQWAVGSGQWAVNGTLKKFRVQPFRLRFTFRNGYMPKCDVVYQRVFDSYFGREEASFRMLRKPGVIQ
jgi:hypothetical protein